MPTTRSHSSTDWSLTWNNILIQGYAGDQKFKVTRLEDSSSVEVGPDGDVVFVALNNHTGELEVTLQRESETNALLSAQMAAWEERPRRKGAGIGVMKVRNVNAPATSALAVNGVIKKWPDMTAGKTTAPCVWVFLLDDVKMFHGGAVG